MWITTHQSQTTFRLVLAKLMLLPNCETPDELLPSLWVDKTCLTPFFGFDGHLSCSLLVACFVSVSQARPQFSRKNKHSHKLIPRNRIRLEPSRFALRLSVFLFEKTLFRTTAGIILSLTKNIVSRCSVFLLIPYQAANKIRLDRCLLLRFQLVLAFDLFPENFLEILWSCCSLVEYLQAN